MSPVENFPRAFPPLPVGDVPSAAAGSSRRRICIVSNEFVGPSRNGGIGTAYTVLADTLAAAGHEVTCLFANAEECASHDLAHWQAQYRRRGVQLLGVPDTTMQTQTVPAATMPYAVYCWLKQNDRFDFIHFPECQALGYYTQLAKRQGLAFASAEICVGLHSMNQWIKEANREYLVSHYDLQLDHMERQSVALADVVWSPSQYLINWIAERGWQLPERCHVQPYVMPHSARQPAAAAENRLVEEFVFFGRLETRKGLALFCDALDRLPAESAARIKQVTFLGREANIDGMKSLPFIAHRAKAWRWPVQVITDKNQPEAVAYMRGPGRLAVMPSLMENSPNTVYECLGSGIAFLASRVGGIPELIAAGDVDRVCFATRPAALAEKLASVLGRPFPAAKLAFEAEVNEQAWIRWHSRQPVARVAPADPAVWPKVSLCLTTYNRPGLLRQALASVEAIDYPNLEVVLVDDGSTQSEAIAFLGQLQPDFAQRGWQIVRQENRYLGAARNTGARHATADLLLFMDDDNYAEPHEVKSLVRAMLAAGADIVTCGMYTFSGDKEPSRDGQRSGWLPLGGGASAGALYNVFGDANALVRRACFEGVGGFTEDYGVTHEDWEFHANAVLKGYKLVVIPEFLFWYRTSNDGMLRTLAPYPNHMRSLRPYLEAVPPALRGLVEYAKGFTMLQTDPGSSPAVLQHLRLSVMWRSKLEAGRELAALGLHQDAARLMLAGIKSIESCKNRTILLEALLETCKHLAPLDPGRTRFLLGLAVGFADKLQRKADKAAAEAMLAALPPVAGAAKSKPAANPQRLALAS